MLPEGAARAPRRVKAFLKQYWPWIVLPFVLVFGLVAVLYFTSDDGGPSPFVYNVMGR